MTDHTQPSGSKRSIVAVILSPLTFLLGPLTLENIFGWIKIILVVLIIQWVWFQPFVVPSGSMEPTLRGNPAFFVGDRVAVNKHTYGIRVPFMNKLLYRGSDPQRWDIVVFNNPDKDAKHPILVKRLVGLPGERIHISGGRVYVNGSPLELPADMPKVYYTSPCPDPEEMQRRFDANHVPESSRADIERQIVARMVEASGSGMKYGVLMDDEHALIPPDHYLMLGDNSKNSGDGRFFGWVPRENLIGPVFCIWWPFGHARDFTGFSKTWWGTLLLYGIPGLFLLYEILTASLVRSWRVSRGGCNEFFRRGDHVVVNQAAFGVRLPFIGVRVSEGRLPRRGELVLYVASGSDNHGHLSVGRVAAMPGERVHPESGGDGSAANRAAPAGHYYICPPSNGEDSQPPAWVAHEDLAGSVLAIWWPLNRARSFAPSDGAAAQDS